MSTEIKITIDNKLKDRYITKDRIKNVLFSMLNGNSGTLDLKRVRENVNLVYGTNYDVVSFKSYEYYIEDLVLEYNITK